MVCIPDDLDALLTRERTAAALTAAGYPVATKTLATKATRGGGPPYSLFSGRALYRWGDALDWAQARMTPPRCSTSEIDLGRKAGMGRPAAPDGFTGRFADSPAPAASPQRRRGTAE
jgi:hypothetical protein